MYFYVAASLLSISLLIVISNVWLFPKVRNVVGNSTTKISLLIPARNEENNIEECVLSVLQQGGAVAEILIYNDHSEDRTGEILTRLSQQYPQIAVVPCRPLLPGWCGKNFACAQLASAASGDWLLFIDADVRLAPNAISSILAEARARNLTFLSCWPKFETVTVAEKILMPMLNFLVFSLYPSVLTILTTPQFVQNEKLGIAHGACMLFERASYEKFDGHERVKDQIFEDTRIAQLWRKSGMRGLCLDGQGFVHLRMYTSGREIWQGFQKNFFPAFKSQTSFWLFIVMHFTIYLLQFILVVFNPNSRYVLLILLVSCIRFLIALRFRQSILSVVFHPFAETLLLLLGISSWWRCISGKGVNWKGRSYQTSE